MLMTLPALGTPTVRYEDIRWTGSNFSSPGCALEKLTISGGKFITGGATFAKGNKDTPIYLSRGGPYLQEIHFARNINVVLYDIKDRRGWLVDGASALLHIVRTQLSSSPYCSSLLFKIEDFHHADPKNGADAARLALTDLRNTEIVIFEDVELWSESTATGQAKKEETKRKTTKWCLQDLVRQTWHILEQIHDHQTRILASPGIALRFTDRDKLEGFGFMDIATGQNPLRPRVSFLKSSGRGWVDFTRSIGAICLLGRGFGELIKPAEDTNNLCRAWESVPKAKDYLVVCITTLHEICMKNGDTESSPLELAKGIYWYTADKLFEPCKCKSDQLGSICDRIQVLLPPLSIGSQKHPDPFNNCRGAAIFGRSRRFDWHWPNVGSPVARTGPEHETDDEGNLQDSGLWTSIDTSSLGAGRYGYSTPSQTPPTSDLTSSENETRMIPTCTNNSDRRVGPSPVRAPSPTTKAPQDSTDRSRLAGSNSTLTAPVEPNIPTLGGQLIESSTPNRQPVDYNTQAPHAENQPRMADRTGAGWKPWQRMKERISRKSRRSEDKTQL